MAAIALTLYITWAVFAFGWRTLTQYRRTGDTGLRLHAEPNTPQWWAKIGFVIAIIIGFAAPIAAVAGLDNIPSLDDSWLHATGVAVTVIGIVPAVAAQYAMGESGESASTPMSEPRSSPKARLRPFATRSSQQCSSPPPD